VFLLLASPDTACLIFWRKSARCPARFALYDSHEITLGVDVASAESGKPAEQGLANVASSTIAR
jgi:hypothetical protein